MYMSPSDEQAAKLLVLELQRFDILKLFTIDTIKQNFSCQFLLEFLLPEGTKPDLGKKFPVDPYAQDFQLSARWYLNKIEPQNLSGDRPWQLMDSKAVNSKDGRVILQMRIEGSFFLKLDLHDFPVDTQELTIKMIYLNEVMKDAMEASAEFGCDAPLSSVLSMPGFTTPETSWEPLGLADDKGTAMLSCSTTVHVAGNRTFPALTATLRVRRKQLAYYNYNVALPAGLISGLSLVTFSYPPNDYSSRVSTSLSLMIAASAYLQVVAAKVPPTNNVMTKLDKYITANFIMLSAVVLVGGTMHHAIDNDGNTTIDNDGWPRPAADSVLFAVLSSAWACIQLSYFAWTYVTRRSTGE